MASLHPLWLDNGGPPNQKIAVSVNSPLVEIIAQYFTWGAFSKQSFKIQRKNK